MQMEGVGRGLPAPHLITFLQEKLTKSLAYILSSQDTVQTQIAELEETVKHTEVRAEGACLSLSCA